MTSLTPIHSFRQLARAMNAGWVLHAEMKRLPGGLRSIKDNDYVLIRSGQRRQITQRTAYAAIQTKKVEVFGALTADGAVMYRWRADAFKKTKRAS